MMTCQQVDQELGALLDGELDTELRQEVETHVAACTSCRALRDEMAGLQRDVHDLPCPPLPDGFNQRVLEALAQRDPQPPWREWLDRALDGVTRLLLGVPPTAPVTPWGFARGALASGATLAVFATASTFLATNQTLYDLYGRVPLLPRAIHDAVQHYPMAPALPSTPWALACAVAALQILLVVGGLRILDLRSLWQDLRSGTPLDVCRLGPVLAGTYLLTMLGGASLQVLATVAVLTTQGTWWNLAAGVLPWLTRGFLILQAVLSLGLVMRKSRLHLGSLSLCFYATLALAWLGDQVLTLAWTAPLDLFGCRQQAGLVLTLLPPARMCLLLFACVPAAGMAGGVLLALLAYRRATVPTPSRGQVAAAAGACVLCLLPLLLAGWQLVSDCRDATRQEAVLIQHAGLTTGPSHPRTVVLLGGSTLGPRAVPFDLPALLDGNNAQRLRDFLRNRPGSPASILAHRMRIAHARLQWDEAAMWQAVFDYGNSGQSSPWMASALTWRVAAASPHARYLDVLGRLISDEFAVTRPQWNPDPVARAFARHGDSTTAARLAASATPSPAGDRPTITHGELRGRLLSGGLPVADIPVRLVGLRDVRGDANTPDDQVLARAVALLQEDHRQAGELRDRMDVLVGCFTATHTDAQGRFVFRGLADDRYLLLLMLDGTVDEVTRRAAGLRQGPVVIDAHHARVDVGDLTLGAAK